MKIALAVFGIISLLVASSLFAQMKAWTDEKGVTHYESVGPRSPGRANPPKEDSESKAPSIQAAEEKKLPRTSEEWRAIFVGDNLSQGFKGKFLDLQRVKVHVLFSVAMCHSTERLSSYMVGTKIREEILENSRSAGRCAREAIETFKPRFQKAQAELASRPAALTKLKSYAAAYLAVMGRIPRAELNSRVLESLQREDKIMLEDKQAELDVELF